MLMASFILPPLFDRHTHLLFRISSWAAAAENRANTLIEWLIDWTIIIIWLEWWRWWTRMIRTIISSFSDDDIRGREVKKEETPLEPLWPVFLSMYLQVLSWIIGTEQKGEASSYRRSRQRWRMSRQGLRQVAGEQTPPAPGSVVQGLFRRPCTQQKHMACFCVVIVFNGRYSPLPG